MRILLAPDSFKGSISAIDLCTAMRKGIHAVDATAIVEAVPMADGGEGTVETLVQATDGELRQAQVSDPLGRPVIAQYGVLGDGRTAVIEMAQASGFALLHANERNPLVTTSRGTGELILHAVRAGFRSFVIGLGGSATNDGGAGMLSALGAKMLDSRGNLLSEGGAALTHLAKIELDELDKEVQQCQFVIASDVTNPLCGEHGASAVFGPQKGATVEMVAYLDAALARYGRMLEQLSGRDISSLPGSGAAGGMGAAFMAVFGVACKPGIEAVLEAVQFDKLLDKADLVITGEGRLDRQTLSGKVIAGICARAARHSVPVIALCGEQSLSGEELEKLGLQAAFSIVPKPCDLDTAMQEAAYWTQQQTEQIMRLAAVFTAKSRR